MEHIRTQIDELVERYIARQEGADQSAIEEAEARLQDVNRELTRITSSKGYQRFLIDYVQAEKERFQDGEVDEPLCSCSNPFCPLKRGTLPAKITEYDDTDEGIQEWLHQHDGDGRVLDSARDEWIDMGGDVISAIREAIGILRRSKRSGDDADEADADDEAAVVRG